MAKLVHGSSADATGAGPSRLLWAVVGAAAALVLAGIALVTASSLTSRSRHPQRA